MVLAPGSKQTPTCCRSRVLSPCSQSCAGWAGRFNSGALLLAFMRVGPSLLVMTLLACRRIWSSRLVCVAAQQLPRRFLIFFPKKLSVLFCCRRAFFLAMVERVFPGQRANQWEGITHLGTKCIGCWRLHPTQGSGFRYLVKRVIFLHKWYRR